VTSITGYPYDELLGLDLWQLAHPDYQAGLKKLGMAQAWVKDVPSRYELKIVTRHGEERWLDLTMSDVDNGGEPAIVVTALTSPSAIGRNGPCEHPSANWRRASRSAPPNWPPPMKN